VRGATSGAAGRQVITLWSTTFAARSINRRPLVSRRQAGHREIGRPERAGWPIIRAKRTMSHSHGREATDLSRRAFLEGTSTALVVAATVPTVAGQTPAAPPAPVAKTPISVTVNGTVHRVEVEDRATLADLLRDQLTLTGTKLGCERGECGACTVILDGKPVYACSQLAVWADGRTVLTVEGLASGGRLHPLQQAFIEHDAPQCGFCTSGQLMAAKALLDRTPHPTPQDVKAALVGVLCRCSNYNRYVEAVVAVGAGRTSPSNPRPTGGAA
jgi:aerobic-type carbon monoxide dehydrogenase small subunit (CoxS/CutS family)